jgi:hypothetical protein
MTPKQVARIAELSAYDVLDRIEHDQRPAKSAAEVARRLGATLVRSRRFIGANTAQYWIGSGIIRFHADLSPSDREEVIGHELGHYVADIDGFHIAEEEAFADAFGAKLRELLAEDSDEHAQGGAPQTEGA